jgi:hypothetical protein
MNKNISDCEHKRKTVVHIRPALMPVLRSPTPPLINPINNQISQGKVSEKVSFFRVWFIGVLSIKPNLPYQQKEIIILQKKKYKKSKGYLRYRHYFG